MFNKKGVSGHIEIIISFLIFISFVSFLLFFINPIEETKETKHYIEIAETSITDRLTAEVSSFSVTVTDSSVLPGLMAGGSAVKCFCFAYDSPNENVSARAEDGNSANAGRFASNSKICIQPTLNSLSGTINKFYRLYFSDVLNEEHGTICTGGDNDAQLIEGSQYRLGIKNDYNLISWDKLGELNSDYNNDYDGLKESLGMETDFNLAIKDMRDGSIIDVSLKEKEPPRSSNIMAKDIFVEIINNQGEIVPATMNLQVWE